MSCVDTRISFLVCKVVGERSRTLISIHLLLKDREDRSCTYKRTLRLIVRFSAYPSIL